MSINYVLLIAYLALGGFAAAGYVRKLHGNDSLLDEIALPVWVSFTTGLVVVALTGGLRP